MVVVIYIYIYMFIYSHNSLGFFIIFCDTKTNNATIFSVGSAASVAPESSEAASAASASATAASSLPAAVLSPDGGGCLLADPGGPLSRCYPYFNEFRSSHPHTSESTFQYYGSRCVQLMLQLPFNQSANVLLNKVAV